MERTVRQSGSVAYSAPTGKHDDLVVALDLGVFGLRRIGALQRHTYQRITPSVSGWT